MPDRVLCIVPEDCPQNFTAFWSQGMQATHSRSRLTLRYAAEAGVIPFSEEKRAICPAPQRNYNFQRFCSWSAYIYIPYPYKDTALAFPAFCREPYFQAPSFLYRSKELKINLEVGYCKGLMRNYIKNVNFLLLVRFSVALLCLLPVAVCHACMMHH